MFDVADFSEAFWGCDSVVCGGVEEAFFVSVGGCCGAKAGGGVGCLKKKTRKDYYVQCVWNGKSAVSQ